MVDEAIYAIRRDMTQDPLAFFFGHEWNMVNTSDSLTYYFTGEAGKRRMRLAAMRDPSHLAQLKPDRMVQPKIRKAFPDTAFWAADLVTDAAGKAQAKVEFPDSLTTWRATARAATVDTRVGAATSKTIVRKNLILRLAVPRFFVQGDEITISALVHNYLTTEKTVRVSLDAKGLDMHRGRHARGARAAARRNQSGLEGARAAGAQRHAHRQGAHRRGERRAGAGNSGEHSGREARRGARRSAVGGQQRGLRPDLPGEGAAGLARAGHSRFALDRGVAVRRAGLPDHVPVRLRGADHVELPAEYRGDAGGQRTRAEGESG